MQILVIGEDAQRYLIKLKKMRHIKVIKHLTMSKKRRRAISFAFNNGELVKELTEHEYPHISADLILSKRGSHWNLI